MLVICSDDKSGLVRALVRHVQAQVGLDLSTLPPEAFTHFVDIQYSRSGAKSADTLVAAADAIAAGAQPPPPAAAKSAAELAAAAAVAAVTAEDSLSGLRVLDHHDPACHIYEQVGRVLMQGSVATICGICRDCSRVVCRLLRHIFACTGCTACTTCLLAVLHIQPMGISINVCQVVLRLGRDT